MVRIVCPTDRGRVARAAWRAHLGLPYTIVEHIDWGGVDAMVYFFASQPVTDDRCVGYCIVARNDNLEQPDEVMQAFARTSARTSAW